MASWRRRSTVPSTSGSSVKSDQPRVPWAPLGRVPSRWQASNVKPASCRSTRATPRISATRRPVGPIGHANAIVPTSATSWKPWTTRTIAGVRRARARTACGQPTTTSVVLRDPKTPAKINRGRAIPLDQIIPGPARAHPKFDQENEVRDLRPLAHVRALQLVCFEGRAL